MLSSVISTYPRNDVVFVLSGNREHILCTIAFHWFSNIERVESQLELTNRLMHFVHFGPTNLCRINRLWKTGITEIDVLLIDHLSTSGLKQTTYKTFSLSTVAHWNAAPFHTVACIIADTFTAVRCHTYFVYIHSSRILIIHISGFILSGWQTV